MARILIAEDEESLRSLIQRGLGAAGHQTAAVADGGAALDLLAAESAGFDLLLADIRMPVMDGIALALAAARDHPQMAILLMTGYAEQRERAHDLEGLIHGVLVKPFALDELEREVAAALAARG